MDWNQLFIEPEQSVSKQERQNASYVRKSFKVDKKVVKASLAMTACGLYQAYLNGEEVDSQKFLPGFTFYEKRLQYQEYDVTDRIRQGENVIGAVIGDGWYRGRIGLYDKTHYYGEKVKFLCILTMEFEDGTAHTVVTDTSWKATQEGPVRKNDLKTGEEYDAMMEMPGWCAPGYDDSGWHQVWKGSYEGKLVAAQGERIIEQEHFSPVVIHTPDGNTVLDFGQNLSGYVRFKVTGHAGDKVTLIHGETLDEQGNFTLKNLQPEGTDSTGRPFGQMIFYTLREGEQEYAPMFSQCGFQYVKVVNWPEELRPENFEAVAVYSDIRVNGTFRCSNPLVNRLVENLKWSQRSNFVDIPTDCPTRERAGWTGDISIFAETACYLSDPERFLLKWMEDVALQQKENGLLPFIVPEVGLEEGMYGSAGWGDVIYTVPWTLYRFYGRREILEKYYDNICRWVEANRRRARQTHPDNAGKEGIHRQYILDTGFHYGEWLEPGCVMSEDIQKAIKHPDEEVATAYFGYSAKMLSEIAGILGKKEDETEYRRLYEDICRAYQTEFLTGDTVVSQRQCRYVRPIMLDLVTEEQKKRIAADLNRMVIENEYKIGTGFLTTPGILSVLTEYGYADTAYKMLENTKQPGWLYAVTKGATTIWENWIGKDENNIPRDSMNHYAPGSVVAWLFGTVAGIEPLKPGYEEILIAPVPGGTLNFCEASTDTCKGKIISSWRCENSRFTLKIQVPAQTTVNMPDGQEYQVGKGEWEFSCVV